MGNATTGIIFVTIVNFLMILAQLSALAINPAGSTLCSTDGGSLLQGANQTAIDVSKFNNTLPGSQSTVSQSNSGLGTDLFNSIISWFKGTTGVKYVTAILTAPIAVFHCVISNEYAAVLTLIAAAWYAITIFVIISYLFWRD